MASNLILSILSFILATIRSKLCMSARASNGFSFSFRYFTSPSFSVFAFLISSFVMPIILAIREFMSVVPSIIERISSFTCAIGIPIADAILLIRFAKVIVLSICFSIVSPIALPAPSAPPTACWNIAVSSGNVAAVSPEAVLIFFIVCSAVCDAILKCLIRSFEPLANLVLAVMSAAIPAVWLSIWRCKLIPLPSNTS